jgi:hypothetical protein
MQTTANLFRNILTIVVLILTISAVNASAATFTVTNTNNAGAGSLRQAITDANAAAGADTIVFSSLFNSAQTITVATTLVIDGVNDTLTITGPGSNLLTVSGNNAVQVFSVSSGEITTISGITVAQGNAIPTGSGGGWRYRQCFRLRQYHRLDRLKQY